LAVAASADSIAIVLRGAGSLTMGRSESKGEDYEGQKTEFHERTPKADSKMV
jgi:hypothetical protein